MAKLWVHQHGGTEPLLVTEMSVADCAAQFDLADAEFLQPLGEQPSAALAPAPLSADPDPKLVLFEVRPEEATAQFKAGYYASHMTADTVQELIGEA